MAQHDSTVEQQQQQKEKEEEEDRRRIGVAIVGAGIFARNTYAPLLMQDDALRGAAEVRAVWSRSESSASCLADDMTASPSSSDGMGEVDPLRSRSCRAYHGEDGLEDLLRSADIEAVLIVLPPKPMLAMALRCLRSGKHVLQEKPIGVDAAGIAQALQEYQGLGGTRPVWGVAENYRFENVFRHAKHLVDKYLGGVDSIINVNLSAAMALSEASPYFHTGWRHSSVDCPGGFLFEGPVHFMAAIRYLVGDQLQILEQDGARSFGFGNKITASAFTENRSALGLDHPDTLTGWLAFHPSPPSDGFSKTCSLFLTYSAKVPQVSIDVVCKMGKVSIERVQGKYVLTLHRPGPESGEEPRSWDFPFSGIKNELRYFLDAIKRYKELSESGGDDRLGAADADPIEEGFPLMSPREAQRDAECLFHLFNSSRALHAEQFET